VKDLYAILDRLQCGERIYADADQVRRVEFEPEATVGDQREQLLPALWRGADEIVIRPGPILDRDLQAPTGGCGEQRIGVLGKTFVVSVFGNGVVAPGKDHENRHAGRSDRLGELEGFGLQRAALFRVRIELVAEEGNGGDEKARLPRLNADAALAAPSPSSRGLRQLNRIMLSAASSALRTA